MKWLHSNFETILSILMLIGFMYLMYWIGTWGISGVPGFCHPTWCS